MPKKIWKITRGTAIVVDELTGVCCLESLYHLHLIIRSSCFKKRICMEVCTKWQNYCFSDVPWTWYPFCKNICHNFNCNTLSNGISHMQIDVAADKRAHKHLDLLFFYRIKEVWHLCSALTWVQNTSEQYKSMWQLAALHEGKISRSRYCCSLKINMYWLMCYMCSVFLGRPLQTPDVTIACCTIEWINGRTMFSNAAITRCLSMHTLTLFAKQLIITLYPEKVTTDVALTIASSMVRARLDYCNAILHGTS